ncbi:thiamine-phosphate kinase [Kushneria aurantia]|uniref:Thiamine-monophosphate kinase n=1 Tax=Kushneria aurantia TaxID=504092 RepID=A0ABV6FZN4_9GAMM|nr:thiamine-phosphate kinase [Kushneria aurantia]
MSDPCLPGEFEIIRRYFMQRQRDDAGIVLGQGDDCALLSPTPGCRLAVSVDTSLADVHFPLEAPAEAIGHRALAVNLSDLAAMGARPRWFVLALTLAEVDESWLADFAHGLYSLARQHDIALVGGDITRGRELSMTITVHGELPAEAGITRCGARPGDLLAVTGALGGAHGGLRAWFDGERSADNPLLDAYLRPRPRVDAGIALRDLVSAGLDISDGLLADLRHLCDGAGTGARLDAEAIPLAPGLVAALGADQALQAALGGGDDYQLLVALPPQNEAAARRALGGALHVIGHVTSEPGIQGVSLKSPGWQHFYNSASGSGAAPNGHGEHP